VNELRTSCIAKSQGLERLAYFYCDPVERPKELYSTSLILRAIVKQLASAPSSTETVMEVVCKKREEKMASGYLNEDDCVELILKLVRSFSRTFIVIDAIDEYMAKQPSREECTLFERLNEILENSASTVNLFFSGYATKFLEKQLESFAELHQIPMIQADLGDIQTFIEKRVKKGVEDGYLLANFSRPDMAELKDHLKNYILQTLKDNAGGMSAPPCPSVLFMASMLKFQ
jgi:hypothetical protein